MQKGRRRPKPIISRRTVKGTVRRRRLPHKPCFHHRGHSHGHAQRQSGGKDRTSAVALVVPSLPPYVVLVSLANQPTCELACLAKRQANRQGCAYMVLVSLANRQGHACNVLSLANRQGHGHLLVQWAAALVEAARRRPPFFPKQWLARARQFEGRPPLLPVMPPKAQKAIAYTPGEIAIFRSQRQEKGDTFHTTMSDDGCLQVMHAL